MSLDELYGPFASLFDQPGPGGLTLLHLSSPGVQVVLDRIEAALRASDGERWLPALLHSNNWRPHLVGAAALLLEPMLDCDLVWHAIDRGSWVTPQLVVTAAFVDPRFRERARSRVEALCPIIVPSGLTPVERHSATGPESQSDRSTKMLASLIAMSRQFSDLAEWRTGVFHDERVAALLARDASWNTSDKIVQRWSDAMRAAFLARGRRVSLADA